MPKIHHFWIAEISCSCLSNHPNMVNNKKGAVDDVCALWPVTKLSGSKKEMSVRFLEDDDVDTAEELPINVPLSAELTNKTPTKKAS